MTDFYMAFTMDDEYPIGLLQINDEGTYVRGLGVWNLLSPDIRQFDDSEVVNVNEDFIEYFDMLDSRDKLPTYKQTKKFAV